MNTSETPEVIDQDRRRLLGTAAMGIAVAGGASLLPSQLIAAPAGDAALETIRVRKEGAVLFAEIAAPPMNLLGPELVRDLVSLIQRAEADDALKVLVFKSADPDYFIPHVDVTRIQQYREEAAKLTGEAVDRPSFPPSERKPPRHHRADRGSRTRRRQRVRAGVRHALCRAWVGDFRSAGAGVGCDPRRRRRATPRAPHGPREGARGHVERAGLQTRSWPKGMAGSIERCPPTRSAISSDRWLIGSPSFRPPASSRSRTGSMRSRSRPSRTSVAIPISSARARATP